MAAGTHLGDHPAHPFLGKRVECSNLSLRVCDSPVLHRAEQPNACTLKGLNELAECLTADGYWEDGHKSTEVGVQWAPRLRGDATQGRAGGYPAAEDVFVRVRFDAANPAARAGVYYECEVVWGRGTPAEVREYALVLTPGRS